jgi:hypothetical protein
MSPTAYLLNAVMLAYILFTNLRTTTLAGWRMTFPLVLASALALIFLRHAPTTGHDLILEITGAAAGVLFGMLAALVVRLAHGRDGRVQATAGAAFAGLWLLAIGGRMVFAYGADHWFTAAIATFSRAHEITGAGAWSAAFMLMAITMLMTRALVTQCRGAVLVRNRQGLQSARAGRGPVTSTV